MKNFPVEVADDIASIAKSSGVVSAELCSKICKKLNIGYESLMIELLPLAAEYAVAPISSFYVGAIVRGVEKDHNGMANLYFGANLEFENQALGHSVHAEQAALSNAWLHGETDITAVAISAPPCGHCRQFFVEVAGDKPLKILLPKGSYKGLTVEAPDPDVSFDRIDLSQLIPAAFGPLDLGCERLLMEQSPAAITLTLADQFENKQVDEDYLDDQLVQLALSAANASYAPYTNNFAGCAIELSTGEMVQGRYAENAAYNPSLPPLAAALSQAVLATKITKAQDVKRAVLVENPTKTSQANVSKLLLKECLNNVTLEVFHTRTINI